MKDSLSIDSITRLLLNLQPYRGFRRTAIDDTIASKAQLAELIRLGYLEQGKDNRIGFTAKAYKHLA